MKIGGMGHAILRVTSGELRELHTIPPEVEFVATLSGGPNLWHSDSRLRADYWHDEYPFYFRIKHRYLPRVGDHGPLVIFTLRDLLRQMEDVAKTEVENRGKPVPDSYMSGSWVEDDA